MLAAFLATFFFSTPTGLVLPIVATTPLMVIPFTHFLEGDTPTWRAVAGGVIAVLGAVLLTQAVR